MLALALLTATLGTTPNDAVGWAIAHQLAVPPDTRPYFRYVLLADYMIPPDSGWDERHLAAALSYAINESASQSGLVVIPQSIANGWILAVYLPNYASATKLSHDGSCRTQLQALVDTWDGLAVDDVFFHTPSEQSGQAVPAIAEHIDPERIQALAELNASPSLVVRGDDLLVRLYDTHYLEFSQSPKTKPALIASLGGNEAASKALNADQRTALFDSGITGKPRRIDRLQGLGGRWGTGLIVQTWDLLDESVSPLKHPMYNLIATQPDGGELIAEKPNGLHHYALFDFPGQSLLREAPPELAADHTIPPPPAGPGTSRLAAGISCVRCHNTVDGWHGAGNDVQRLLAAGTDITDDILGIDQPEAVERIAGLYAGDFMARLRLGRIDYENAVRRATIQPGLPAGLSVKEAGEVVSGVYAHYWWSRVDAKRALAEVGRTDKDFDEVFPRDSERGTNVVIEALRAGIEVRRQDWNQVYPAAMSEAMSGRTRDK